MTTQFFIDDPHIKAIPITEQQARDLFGPNNDKAITIGRVDFWGTLPGINPAGNRHERRAAAARAR